MIRYIDREAYTGKEACEPEGEATGQKISELSFKNKGDCYQVEGYEGEDSEVVIPASFEGKPVTSIGDGAFANCKCLTKVTIPKGIEVIGKRAFFGCTGLTKMSIPESVWKIGGGAFSGCTALERVFLEFGLRDIGGSAFMNCTNLTYINLPIGVFVMDKWVFRGCEKLTIHCEGTEPEIEWDPDWNPDNLPVMWAKKKSFLGRLFGK